MVYFNRAGLRLFYAESGTGLPVLWHTGGCGDATMWDTAGYLAALPGYRHILFDHRGHGRSEGPTELAGHAMACYVDDVIAVLEDAGISRAVLIGYSQGARVGYAVAMAYPQRLAGLVALDSVPDPAEQPASLRDDAGEVLARGTAAIIEEMAAAESEPPPAWLLEHLSATDPFAFAGAYETFATAPAFWPAAGQITVPTLLLLGVPDDEQDYWALGQAAAAAMPRARAVALSGLGHLQAFWRTEVSIPPIKQFLATLDSAAQT